MNINRLWWEKDNLFIEQADGQVWCYTGAYVKDVDFGWQPDECIEEVKMDVRHANVQVSDWMRKALEGDKK